MEIVPRDDDMSDRLVRFWPVGKDASDVWRGAPLVTDDEYVARWLRLNELSPSLVAARDLARAVPPVWLDIFKARPSRTFDPARERLLMPLHGLDGSIETLHAEDIMPVGPFAAGTAPPPASRKGLLFANRRARLLLAAGSVPPGFVQHDLLIVESAVSFLRRAAATDPDPAPAVIGVLPGTWSSTVAAHIPVGTRVTVIAREDTSSPTSFPMIVADLRGRCDVSVQRRK